MFPLYCRQTSHEHASAASWQRIIYELPLLLVQFARSFEPCKVTEGLHAQTVISECKLFRQLWQQQPQERRHPRTWWRDGFHEGGSLIESGTCCHWFSVHIVSLGEKNWFEPRSSLPLYTCSQQIGRFLFKIFAVNLPWILGQIKERGEKGWLNKEFVKQTVYKVGINQLSPILQQLWTLNENNLNMECSVLITNCLQIVQHRSFQQLNNFNDFLMCTWIPQWA